MNFCLNDFYLHFHYLPPITRITKGRSKLFTAFFFIALPIVVFSQQNTFNIIDYGAKADGISNNAISIQTAIDAAAEAGGIVLFPSGNYLTGPIVLRSNVTLRLSLNAVLIGSSKRKDYGTGSASPLIVAHNVQNIAITGTGTIDGNGTELLKDIIQMLNAGTLKDSTWGKLNPWHQNQPQESNRPKIIGFTHCKNITLKSITLKNGVDWVEEYKNCTNMVMDSIGVISNSYWNNDGIDLVDCKNVKLTNSYFNADDDGICLKSEARNGLCENIYVAHCTIRSSANGIKFGTASYGGFKKIKIMDIKIHDTYRSAIALECVDGGVMEDVDIRKIKATNTGNAIFIRLGHRNKDSVFGSINRIQIHNVRVEVPAGKPDKGYPFEGPELRYPHNVFPSSIAGLPGHPVRNVLLENIQIVYKGVANKKIAEFGLDSLEKVRENAGGYPEFSMFGELPAWGFYTRHSQGITFKNVIISCLGDDFRSACIFDDVHDLNLNNLKIPQVKGLPVILLHGVKGGTFHTIKIPGKYKNKVQTRL